MSVRDHHALVAHLASVSARPFAWGSHDCALFAAGAVRAQTGRDPLKGLAHWTTERGARRVLKRLGGLEAAVDRVLTPVAPSLAKRGDVALVKLIAGEALAIVEGDTLAYAGANGVGRLPRRLMVKAWSAG